jgi:hypothetical protein
MQAPRFPKAVGGAVIALAVVAAVVFAGVGIHEFGYASDHPYAFGPAKVIAWAAGAGALLSVAVALLAFSLTRADCTGP